MRFFKPRPGFWTWVEQFKGKTIVDCGCGDGALVKEMLGRSLHAIGVDPRFFSDHYHVTSAGKHVEWDLASKIIPLMASQVRELWQSAAIILCCRPCHNGFPGEVVEMMGDAAEFYYIGFAKNLDADIGDGDDIVITPVLYNVGEDNENLYRVIKV